MLMTAGLVGLAGLGGCASTLLAVQNAFQTNYDPTPDIRDIPPGKESQVTVDVARCKLWAMVGAETKYNLGTAASAVGEGAANNLSTAAVPGAGWLGPALGGVGGVLAYSAQWAGILSIDSARALQQCVRQELEIDHAGVLVEAPL